VKGKDQTGEGSCWSPTYSYRTDEEKFTIPIHPHPLVHKVAWSLFEKRLSAQWTCDACKSLHKISERSWHCDLCRYDLCPTCCHKQIPREHVTVKVHPHGLLRSYRTTQWKCNGRQLEGGCRRGEQSFNAGFVVARYRCDVCDFDLCDLCKNAWLKEAPKSPKRETVAVTVHQHYLIRDYDDNGWGCNGRNYEGGCRRGITGFQQTTGMPRYRCDVCDFDLCDGCKNAYATKVPPNNPVQRVSVVVRGENKNVKPVVPGENKNVKPVAPDPKGETKQVPAHPHPLTHMIPYEGKGWSCDVCATNHKDGEAWHCHPCGFDLCGNCMAKQQGQSGASKLLSWAGFGSK